MPSAHAFPATPRPSPDAGKNKFVHLALHRTLTLAAEIKSAGTLQNTLGHGLDITIVGDNDFYSQRAQVRHVLPATLASTPTPCLNCRLHRLDFLSCPPRGCFSALAYARGAHNIVSIPSLPLPTLVTSFVDSPAMKPHSLRRKASHPH